MRIGENVSVAAVPGVVVRRHSAARFTGTGCLGESGQEAHSSFRTDGKTSSLPAGEPWGAGHGGRLGRPYFAHLPCEVEEGPARRCSDREVLLCTCPDWSPQREPPRTVSVPLEPRPPRSPDCGPYSQPVLGGVDAPRGTARRGVWEACGQSGGSRALAPPSSELGSRPGSHPQPAAGRAHGATPRGARSGLRVLAPAAWEAGMWYGGGCHLATPLALRAGLAPHRRPRPALGGGSPALSLRAAARALPSGPDRAGSPSRPPAQHRACRCLL